jgi:YggT family protein
MIADFFGLVLQLVNIYGWIIVAASLITWVSPDPRNPVVQFLRRVTEPVLAPFRRLLPPWKTGGLDISPMIVLIIIWVVLPRVFSMILQALY